MKAIEVRTGFKNETIMLWEIHGETSTIYQTSPYVESGWRIYHEDADEFELIEFVDGGEFMQVEDFRTLEDAVHHALTQLT